MNDSGRPGKPERASASPTPPIAWLTAAGVVTVVLWQVPFGAYVLYPFTILATWFHEMGHGAMAMLLGGDFARLLIYPDGSGLAYHSGHLLGGPIGRALVAAAGPMGPSLAGAAFILSSRHAQRTRVALCVLGAVMLISVAFWIRTALGMAIIGSMGLLILTLALRASPNVRAFAIQFLGVQACISTYRTLDYLFMQSAEVGGSMGVSDSGQIAQNLLLPYWFWGGLLTITSLGLLGGSLTVLCRERQRALIRE